MEIYFHVDHPERILFTGPAFSYWVTSDYGKTYTRVRHAMQRHIFQSEKRHKNGFTTKLWFSFFSAHHLSIADK